MTQTLVSQVANEQPYCCTKARPPTLQKGVELKELSIHLATQFKVCYQVKCNTHYPFY